MEYRPTIRSDRVEISVLIWKVPPGTLRGEKADHVTGNSKRSHLCEIVNRAL